MVDMDAFRARARLLSDAGNYRELIEEIKTQFESLIVPPDSLGAFLDQFDCQHYTLVVMYILLDQMRSIDYVLQKDTVDPKGIIFTLKTFFSKCNAEQIKFNPHDYKFIEMCHQLTGIFTKNKLLHIHGISILTMAIDKLQQFKSQLTPIHADLCQLCLCGKLFKPALKYLDVDVTAIVSTDDSNHDSRYFLLYYYYGGMIYVAMKNYDQALYFFEVAVSTPSLAMSHIMLESYKKYILVSLILHGKMLAIPKYSSQVISRFMKPLSVAYHDLVNAYSTANSEHVSMVINKHQDVFVRDKNFGLVKQVAGSLYKKNIQRLTKTFLTLSLEDVASRVQLNGSIDAERYILNMIKSGEIFASINQKDGMVVFKDDPEKHNTPVMFTNLQAEISRVMELNKQISKMEEEIMLHPVFVKKSGVNQEDDIGSQSKAYSGDPAD